MATKQSTIKNYFYNSFYNVLALLIPLVTTPYLTRVLGAEKLGVYSFSISVASYFVLFIMLGLNNYGNRTIAKIRDNKEETSKEFSSIYCMQLLSGTVAIVIYLLYAYFYSGFDLANEKSIVTWIFLIYVLSGIFDVTWLFFGLEQFKLTALRSSGVKILSAVLIIMLVKSRDDVYIYALITSITALLSQILLWPFVKRNVDYRRVRFADIKKHIIPNFKLFIPVVAVSLYTIMDKIMLGALSNMTEVGYYHSAYQIIAIPSALISSLGTVMLPKISNIVGREKQERKQNDSIYSYLIKSLSLVMVISSVIVFGIMGISPEFVPIFFGEGFDPCIILLQVLLPSCLFSAFSNVIRTQYLIPKERDKEYIFSVIFGAVVNLIVNFICIPVLGSIGAAIGTVIAEFAVLIYQIISVKAFINIKRLIAISIPTIIASLIMYIILVLFQLNNNVVSLILKIFIGGVIYFSIIQIEYIINKTLKGDNEFFSFLSDSICMVKKIIRNEIK